MSIGSGFPLAESYARQLAWAMQKGSNVGDYQRSKNRFENEQKCSGDHAFSGDGESVRGQNRGLSVAQLSGVFISVFCILLFGVLLSLVSYCTAIGGPSVYAKARSHRKSLLNNMRVKTLRSKNIIRTAGRSSVTNPYADGGTGTSTF